MSDYRSDLHFVSVQILFFRLIRVLHGVVRFALYKQVKLAHYDYFYLGITFCNRADPLFPRHRVLCSSLRLCDFAVKVF